MKHAYLIIAHNDFSILEKQLRLLDDPQNDFYIHIDKKVKQFPFEKFHHILHHSKIYFIKRISIKWGHFSMVKCELNLLEAAIKGQYHYYHLLSGADMPLKSQNEIYSFFEKHHGKDFVHFTSDDAAERARHRICAYHCMWAYTKSKNSFEACIKNITQKISHIFTKIFGGRKYNQKIAIAYGSQWFSITHKLAEYVVAKKSWIYKHFRFTSCPDEHFLQMIIKNFDLEDSLFYPNPNNDYLSCLRYIDWSRGNPYTFRTHDFESLINSPFLFARKFNTGKDALIVDMLFDYVKTKNTNANTQNEQKENA